MFSIHEQDLVAWRKRTGHRPSQHGISRLDTLKSYLVLGKDYCKAVIKKFLRPILMASGIGCLLYVIYKLLKRLVTQYRRSQFLKYFMRSPVVEPRMVRDAFNNLPMTEHPKAKNHTHPIAAADRSGASIFIDRIGSAIGCTPYMYQASHSDWKHKRSGFRAWYWIKDMISDIKSHPPDKRTLLAMVDVDQYVEMPEFLDTWSCPTILYTFQPTVVARVGTNYCFTFDENDVCTYDVAGSGKFVQKVWNYSRDNIKVCRKFLGFTWSMTAFLVDRVCTSQDHEVIMLTPMGSWRGISAFFADMWLEGRPLERLRVHQNGFLRLRSVQDGKVTVSTGKPGRLNSCEVTAQVDDSIRTIAETSKYDISLPQILSFMPERREEATVLLSYHRACVKDTPDTVCPVFEAVRRYQFEPKMYDPEAKPGLVAFMSPLIHGCFSPDITAANERRAIKSRIRDVMPGELVMSPLLSQTIDEFCCRLIPDSKVHKLAPVSYEEVLERQTRPSQRRILADSEVKEAPTEFERKTHMFLKREAYTSAKDPRAISQINGVDKRDYSRVMYAFEELLKHQSWYAFGRTPREIADIVCIKLAKAKIAIATDYSRFDGHGSNLMRELERRLLIRAFMPEYHGFVTELHRSQYGLIGVSANSQWYFTGTTRASGSPETSIFNTTTNAFIAFLAKRMTNTHSGYCTPDEAWSGLGIYGGDDGLTADVVVRIYVRAAKMMGQVLDAVVVQRGHLGVKFLSRCYGPDVWTGDPISCCDILRQLSKFHTSVKLHPDVTPFMKLCEKIRSYALSDSGTPIICNLVSMVLSITGEIKMDDKTAMMRSWLSQFEIKSQYPNDVRPWMLEYAFKSMPTFNYPRFERWVNDFDNTVEYILNAPMFMEPLAAKPSAPMVIDDSVVGPPAGDVGKFDKKTAKDEKKQFEITHPPAGVSRGRGRGRGGRGRGRGRGRGSHRGRGRGS